MKKSFLFFALMVLLFMGFGVDSNAEMRGHGMGMGMEMGQGMCGKGMGMSGERPMMGAGMMAMSKNLGLDEKQTTAFKAIHLQMKKERIQKNAEISIAELELREVLDNDPVDMKTAEAKVRQIESLRAGLKILHIRTHEAVKAMLTPEQRKKLDSFMGMGMMGCGMGMDCAKGMGHDMGMMGNRPMGGRGGMMQMNRMKQADEDAEQDTGDMDDSDLHEGHAH